MIYEHQLRRFADLLDEMAETSAELAGGARNSEEILTLTDLHRGLKQSSHELRRYALRPVPDPDEAA